MDEIWKDINGYDGIYQISNLANFRRYRKRVLQLGPFGKRNFDKTIKPIIKRSSVFNHRKLQVFFSKINKYGIVTTSYSAGDSILTRHNVLFVEVGLWHNFSKKHV